METDPRGLLPEEIAAVAQGMGEPAYRGEQIFSWIQSKAASSYDEMTNLGKALRARLEERLPLGKAEAVDVQESADGTKKFLFSLADGLRIESVLMRHREETGHIRFTACLSTQVGCAMGCLFCATGGMGFQRNLTAGEIAGQALYMARTEGRPIDNAVYMGMGEPLLNEDAVKKSIEILHHPLGQNIGARRFTVSTCGIPEGIRRMADWDLDVVLAVSLHAADDETRSRLMPVNRRYPLKDLLDACRAYCAKTGKRITFEYVMIQGVNASRETAETLGRLLEGIMCNLNLIPVNPGAHPFVSPGRSEQEMFIHALEKAGIPVVIRQERGGNILGACGQLAAKK